MFFMMLILSMLTFECLHTTTLYSATHSDPSRDAAATKIQAMARGHMARKEIAQKENAATRIQAIMRGRKARKEFEILKKQHAAAKVIQKAGQGMFARQEVAFHKMLSKVPYDQFRNLLCSGDFLDKTDWFYKFIEGKEKKQIFKRNGTDKDENKVIDINNPELLKPAASTDLDKLLSKHIDAYLEACFGVFIDRALDEITLRKMPWSKAISIIQDGKPVYPLGYSHKCDDPDCESNHFQLFLPMIFNDVYVKLMPEFPMETTIEYSDTIDSSGNETETQTPTFIVFKALKMERWVHIEEGQTPQEVIDEHKDEMLQDFLYEYCLSLGAEALDVDDPSYGLELETEEPKYEDYVDKTTYNFDEKKWSEGWDKYHQLQRLRYDQKESNIDWHLAAYQTFELGRLLFENKLDAFGKLGGMAWLKKQPEDIQQVILAHIKKLEGKSIFKQSLKSTHLRQRHIKA